MRRRLFGIPWWDALLAGVLVAAALTEALHDRATSHPLAEVVAVLFAGSVALRTRQPRIMAVCSAAGLLLLPHSVQYLWVFVSAFVIAFSIALNLTWRWALVCTLLVLVAAGTAQGAAHESLVSRFVAPVVIVGAPALAGGLLRRSLLQARRLRDLAAELERERGRHAELAAAAERARISRELHDVLAHTLSTVAVQAGAAQQLIGAEEPGRQQVDAIAAGAREAMGEVRSLLALTRSPAPTDPQPGLERLPALVAADGAALVVHGTATPVPAGVSLAAFRLVQEALTNARRHAPGQRATVTVDYAPGALQVSIENGGPTAAVRAGGRGLVGMAERVAAHAGDLQVGPGAGGRGWAVRARFPHEGADA